MASALIDASVLVAVFGQNEPRAQHYAELLALAAMEHWALSTTWPCVVEASHLVPPPNRFEMLQWIGEGAIMVFPFEQSTLLDLTPLMLRYTERPRTEMDLADASLLWLARETNVTTFMTQDGRDFTRNRLPDGRVFQIL